MMSARENTLSRRRLLAGAGAGLAALGLPACAPPVPPGPPLGLQLYTVRAAMAQDVSATLARVAALGYREVEFAGYFGATPAEIRRIVAEAGLTAPAAHISPFPGADQVPANAARWIDEAREAGHQTLVVPWLDPDQRRTLDQFRQLADAMNALGEQCRAAGLDLAYHNHDFEFAALDGAQPYDLLLQRCAPDLVAFELDLYWAVHGGRDPLALLADHPGRFPLCHVKDRATDGRMADVGAGGIDFAAIFASPDAAFRHYFVERDDAPDPFSSAAVSYAGALQAFEAAGLPG